MAKISNPYKDFQKTFAEYVKYSQGAQRAYSGDTSPAVKDLTASLNGKEENYREFVSKCNSAKTLYTLLGTATKQKEEEAKELAKHNLEGILQNAPEEEIMLGLNLVEPKSEYNGANAQLYQEISKLHKKYRKRAKASPEEIRKEVSEKYKKKYDSDKNKLELMETLMKVDPEFIKFVYVKDTRKTEKELAEKLKGNEIGYLKANLEGTDFLNFYANLQGIKAKLAEKQE